MKKKNNKRFVIKKYVMALSARDAIRKERTIEVDDIWIDEDWKKDNSGFTGTVGYRTKK